MIEVHGKYGEAIVFTQLLEPSAEKQIRTFCDRPQSENSKIRIMPDVHTGKGCVIGMTMTITDQVIPNLVGVDIGCGMLTVKLKEKRLNFPELNPGQYSLWPQCSGTAAPESWSSGYPEAVLL